MVAETIEPTHDADAEIAVLASALASATARDEARRHVTAADFGDPATELIFGAMATLERHGKAVDATTLNATLAGDATPSAGRALRMVPDIVTTLTDPDNVGHHADIVRGWATRRRLHAEATRTAQQSLSPGINPSGYAAGVVNRFAAIRDHGADDITAQTLAELMDSEDDPFDWLIPGLLERGDRLMLTGAEGLGKALDVTTPVPSPKGWTTMGALSVGDQVFAPDGTPTRVLATTETMYARPCYRVRFSDGSNIIADEQHLWRTMDYRARQPRARVRTRALKPRGTDQRQKRHDYAPAVRTTRDLARTLRARGGHTLNHSIETCEPLIYPRQEMLIEPYTLGAWLGDGSSSSGSITVHPDDREILDNIAAGGWPVRKLNPRYLWGIGDGSGKGKRGTSTFAGCLRALGVFGDKHVPTDYLTASVEQRLALLQGLMDTDGTVGAGAAPIAEFSVVCERLARDVHELLLSLGIKVKWHEGPARLDGRVVGTRYRLAFQTGLPVFRLRRKAERIIAPRTQRYRRRYIAGVEPVEPVPVRCIQVDRADGMFVVGRECIPTHNSSLLRQIAVLTAAGLHPFRAGKHVDPVRAVIIDCENSERQVKRQLRPLHSQACISGSDPGPRVLIECTGRLDITRDRDLAEIHHLLDAMSPDMCVLGPMYRLAPRGVNSDDEAGPVLAALDTIRDRGVALLIEAHAGHAIGGDGRRNFRPRGSSALLGWPEFGYGMADIGGGCCDLLPWRGDRDERAWPTRLRRAQHMCWKEIDDWIPGIDDHGEGQ